MPEKEAGRVQRPEQLEGLLNGLRLVRTGVKGYPQDGRYYLGRDDLSVWLQTGRRALTSTADTFEFLRPDPIEAFIEDNSRALTYEMSLKTNDELMATLAGKLVWVRVLGRDIRSGRERLILEVLPPAPPPTR